MFWCLRVLTTLAPILWILWNYRCDNMKELIALTPAEFGPELLMEGFVLGAIITFAISLCLFSEQAKVVARTTGEKLAYGMNYLTKNIVVLVLAGVAALIVPGYYYDLVGAVPTEGGCLLIGAVAAIVVGLGGEKIVTYAVEFLRNRSKAAEALNAVAETPAEPAVAGNGDRVPKR